jgi:LUD domain
MVLQIRSLADRITGTEDCIVRFVLPDPGPVNAEFARPADRERLERTAEALSARGFHAHVVADGAEARQFVLDAVPEGAEVHTALSETLTELGIRAEIEESGRYDSVRAKLALLDRETQGREMRKLGAAPDYIVGSAHAITDDGVVMVGSGSGSLLAKTLLIEHEPGGRIIVILVPETLGF